MSSFNPLRADEVEPENIEYLWGTPDDPELIPRGMLSMIAGRPDQGKSMIATRIAADVTQAGGNVLYSSKERSFGLMEKPRFVAAGGIESRMHYWRFSLPLQFEELADHIMDKGIDLVVMDPVSAHFIGISKASDKIREVTNPLTELMEATGCAMLMIEHALKRVAANAHPLNAIAGNSSGLPAACAMAFLFGSDPQNEDRKVLAAVKNNIRDRPLAAVFEVDGVEVDGVEKEVPALVYDEMITFDPVRLVSREPTHGKVGRPNDKRAAAAEWLTDYLARAGGPVLGVKVKEDAKHYGMTERTLRRAASDMGVVKSGGGPGQTWELPQEVLDLLAEGDDEAIQQAGAEMAANLEQEAPSDAPWAPTRARSVLAYINLHLEADEPVEALPSAAALDAELDEFLKGLQ